MLEVARKPKGYYSEGRGINRKVHPLFEPKGPRLPKSKSAHPSRDVAYNSHVERELAEIHRRRSIRAQRTDEAYPKGKVREQTPLEKEKTDIAWLRKYSLEELEDRENQFVRMTSRSSYNKVLKEKMQATPKVEKPYLEVIWTKNHLLKHREFPIEKKEQAFNWWWRRSGGQIVIRNVEGVPSFTEDEATRRKSSLKWNPKKEGYKQTYQEWLKERGGVGSKP